MHKIYNIQKTPLETYYIRTYKTLTFSSEVNYVFISSTFQMFQIG